MFYNFEIKYEGRPPHYLIAPVFNSELDATPGFAQFYLELIKFDLTTKYYAAWHEMTIIQFNAVTRHLNSLIDEKNILRYRVEERRQVGSDELGIVVHIFCPEEFKPKNFTGY